MRADARRNLAAIVRAAQDCLVEDPEATVAQIAQRAGVGRVTLYGHFPTRADLVDAAFQEATAAAATLLSEVDTGGEPTAALTRFLTASWQVVHRSRALHAAAQRELPADRIKSHHDEHLARLTALVERGRQSGSFRTDVPTHWLVTVAYTVMHAAADESRAGHLADADAEHAILTTVLGAFQPAGRGAG
jgi:TetR/AcrR family transcriptional regulator, mexCD-oprJ operon repressor